MDTDDWFSSNVITSDFVPFTSFPKFPLFKKMWNWSAYTKKSCCFTFYFNGTKNQKVIRSTQELFALLLKQENQKWKYKYKLIQLVCSDNFGRNFFFLDFCWIENMIIDPYNLNNLKRKTNTVPISIYLSSKLYAN